MTYTILEPSGRGDNWLRERQPLITASDAPTIVNLSPWKTPHQLWLEKMSPTITDDDRDLFYFAHELEGPIARRMEQKWPERFARRMFPSPGLVVWDDAPFLGATPDAMVEDPDHGDVPVQIKTVNSFARKAWGDMAVASDVPDHYRIQVIQEAVVTGAPGGWLAPLEGLHKLHAPIWIPVDWEFWEWYFEQAEAWHNAHMVQRHEPEITFGDEAFIERWPGNRGEEKLATAELVRLARAAKLWRDGERKRAEELDEHTKRQIAEYLLDATELIDPATEETLVTYRPKASPDYFDVKAFRAAHPGIAAEFTRPGKPQRSMLFKDTEESRRAKTASAARNEQEAIN
jgi:putative phage-type endonuclease